MKGENVVYQKERVTKLQAVRRQLVVATQLYFYDSDAVAIHTLVAAAYNVLRDISRHHGIQGMSVKDYFPTTIPESKQPQVIQWINSFENFFKHADRDPDPNGMIELNPEVTEIMLIDAWSQYERLCGDNPNVYPAVYKAFKTWAGNTRSEASKEIKLLISSLRTLNKQEFYKTYKGFFCQETR
jgi:hypothetical protein